VFNGTVILVFATMADANNYTIFGASTMISQ